MRRPTAERLLDVRTPAEIAFAPDGSRVAFALHSTVADAGSFVPSDLYLIDGRRRAEPVRLTRGRVERPNAGVVSGRIAVGVPLGPEHAWAPAPVHDGPRAMHPCSAGTFAGSAESLAWSSDGERLLVLVADPVATGWTGAPER